MTMNKVTPLPLHDHTEVVMFASLLPPGRYLVRGETDSHIFVEHPARLIIPFSTLGMPTLMQMIREPIPPDACT